LERHFLAVPVSDKPDDAENYDTDDVGRARQSNAQRLEGSEIVLHGQMGGASYPAVVVDAAPGSRCPEICCRNRSISRCICELLMATNTKQIGRNEKNIGSHKEAELERAQATKAKIHSNTQKAVGIQREGAFI
jgi:hypothetical protein